MDTGPQGLPAIGRVLVALGAALLVVGGLLVLSGRLPWLGRLPGDIAWRRGRFSVYVPIATCLLLSVLLTLLLWLFRALFRK